MLRNLQNYQPSSRIEPADSGIATTYPYLVPRNVRVNLIIYFCSNLLDDLYPKQYSEPFDCTPAHHLFVGVVVGPSLIDVWHSLQKRNKTSRNFCPDTIGIAEFNFISASKYQRANKPNN